MKKNKNSQETISLWQGLDSLSKYETLKENIQADVCVIGGGISGLSAAYHLGQSGKKVVLLEDGAIAGGQTIRTTAHLSNALDDRFYHLERYFGTKGAKLAAEAHTYSIEFVRDFVKKHHVKCNFKNVDAYLFVPPDDSLSVLDKEKAAASRAGLEVELIAKAPIESFFTGPALRFGGQAEFSPVPFIDALCEKIQEKQTLFTSVHATKIKEMAGRYHVETSTGHKVIADHVVIATNSPIWSRFLPHLKQAPYTTYVIAAKMRKGIIKSGLYYDTLDPYHYIRTALFDDTHEYIIIGGEDHRVAEKKDTDSVFTTLEKWSRDRFPELGSILYRWSGQVLEPVDSLGFIGRIKDEMYMITGDSGNGLTNGIFGGYLVNELIHKKESRFEKLFSPHRKTLKTACDFIKENCNTAYQYRDWITPGDHKSAKNLPNNTGAIIRSGLKKYAMYRDKDGKLHKMSAVCPHLQAHVRWNETEHCWECPAHGSRFSAIGKVLQGPANSDLIPSIKIKV